MAKKELTRTSKFLIFLLGVGEGLSVFFPTPREFARRGYWGEFFEGYPQFKNLAYYLYRRGYIKFVDKDNERFIELTKNGELQALLQKAKIGGKAKKWDGKWRLIMYDIPEESKDLRQHFRWLLQENNFYKLQHSVFISPYPLNREAIIYLNEKGLIKYIRILKIEEMDNDQELKKHFKLPNS